MKGSRERLFGLIVVTVAVFLAGFFLYSWVAGQFDRAVKEIARLKNDIQKFERTSALGRTASRKIAQFEERSLPANPEVARTRYQTWLVNEMELAGLIEPDVRQIDRKARGVARLGLEHYGFGRLRRRRRKRCARALPWW